MAEACTRLVAQLAFWRWVQAVAAAAKASGAALSRVSRAGDCGARKETRAVLAPASPLQPWQALDRLPFDQRTALILREVDGLRYDEIAYSLGIAVGTVKSRLTRARQALRAELLGLHA